MPSIVKHARKAKSCDSDILHRAGPKGTNDWTCRVCGKRGGLIGLLRLHPKVTGNGEGA